MPGGSRRSGRRRQPPHRPPLAARLHRPPLCPPRSSRRHRCRGEAPPPAGPAASRARLRARSRAAATWRPCEVRGGGARERQRLTREPCYTRQREASAELVACASSRPRVCSRPAAALPAKQARCSRGAAEVQPRGSREAAEVQPDAAEVQPRCSRGAAEVQPRCSREAAERRTLPIRPAR